MTIYEQIAQCNFDKAEFYDGCDEPEIDIVFSDLPKKELLKNIKEQLEIRTPSHSISLYKKNKLVKEISIGDIFNPNNF